MIRLPPDEADPEPPFSSHKLFQSPSSRHLYSNTEQSAALIPMSHRTRQQQNKKSDIYKLLNPEASSPVTTPKPKNEFYLPHLPPAMSPFHAAPAYPFREARLATPSCSSASPLSSPLASSSDPALASKFPVFEAGESSSPAEETSEDIVSRFWRENPHLDPQRYPMTTGLLNESRIDKLRKKKGGYRCGGPKSDGRTNFTSILDFAKHLDELGIRNPYKCGVAECTYSVIGFNTLGSLKRHAKTHGYADVVKCSRCHRSFPNIYNAQRHEKQVHNLP